MGHFQSILLGRFQRARHAATLKLGRIVIFKVLDAPLVDLGDVGQTINGIHGLDRSLGEHIHSLGEHIHPLGEHIDSLVHLRPLFYELRDLFVVGLL
jgi:hypothetical protein